MLLTFLPLIAIVAAVLLLVWAVPVRLWIEARFSGVALGLGNLVGMRLRKVSPPAVVRPLIASTKAGLFLDVSHLEAHYLAGGNVDRVARALISADKAAIDLPFQQAAAIDLAGRDVFEAVQVSVNPKVVQTPRVAAMAKDGIQLIAVARVTVRANINRLVGRCRRRDHPGARGRGHRFDHRLGELAQGGAGKPRCDLQDRAAKGTRLGDRLRDPLHRHRRRSMSGRTSGPNCRPTRPRPTSAWRRPGPRSGARWRRRASRR